MTKQTFKAPSYIKGLLKPVAEKAQTRKVWSIALETTWIPFFTAANVTGETSIAADVLGAPLRLAKDKDGTVRFSQNGRPVLRVHKDLSNQIRMAREQFEASLLAFAVDTQKAMPEAYKAQVGASLKAGAPILERQAADIDAAIVLRAAQAEAETLEVLTGEAQTEAPAAEAPGTPEPERELVPA